MIARLPEPQPIPAPKLMPELPRPGQKVRWRYPQHARRWGWEALFSPGPFAVVGIVDNSRYRLATDLILRTKIGERAISEVWLALADEPENVAGGPRAVSPGSVRWPFGDGMGFANGVGEPGPA
jgi:hypothetical protein